MALPTFGGRQTMTAMLAAADAIVLRSTHDACPNTVSTKEVQTPTKAMLTVSIFVPETCTSQLTAALDERKGVEHVQPIDADAKATSASKDDAQPSATTKQPSLPLSLLSAFPVEMYNTDILDSGRLCSAPLQVNVSPPAWVLHRLRALLHQAQRVRPSEMRAVEDRFFKRIFSFEMLFSDLTRPMVYDAASDTMRPPPAPRLRTAHTDWPAGAVMLSVERNFPLSSAHGGRPFVLVIMCGKLRDTSTFADNQAATSSASSVRADCTSAVGSAASGVYVVASSLCAEAPVTAATPQSAFCIALSTPFFVRSRHGRSASAGARDKEPKVLPKLLPATCDDADRRERHENVLATAQKLLACSDHESTQLFSGVNVCRSTAPIKDCKPLHHSIAVPVLARLKEPAPRMVAANHNQSVEGRPSKRGKTSEGDEVVVSITSPEITVEDVASLTSGSCGGLLGKQGGPSNKAVAGVHLAEEENFFEQNCDLAALGTPLVTRYATHDALDVEWPM